MKTAVASHMYATKNCSTSSCCNAAPGTFFLDDNDRDCDKNKITKKCGTLLHKYLSGWLVAVWYAHAGLRCPNIH